MSFEFSILVWWSSNNKCYTLLFSFSFQVGSPVFLWKRLSMKTRRAVATIILCCYLTKLFNYRSSHLIALVFRCLLDDHFEFNCLRIQYDLSNLFEPGAVHKSRYTFNFAFLFVNLKYWLDNVLWPFHETYTVYYQTNFLVFRSLLKSGSNVTMNNLLFPFIYRNWICFYFFTAQAVFNQ